MDVERSNVNSNRNLDVFSNMNNMASQMTNADKKINNLQKEENMAGSESVNNNQESTSKIEFITHYGNDNVNVGNTSDNNENYNSLGNMSSASVETVKNNFANNNVAEPADGDASTQNNATQELNLNPANLRSESNALTESQMSSNSNGVSLSVINAQRNYISSNQSTRSTLNYSRNNLFSSQRQFTIPIIGYEVMEERARFTIYKLRIDDPKTGLSWMVFRRYTDFLRLFSKLKSEYHNLQLPMPEKRRFLNNFDPNFLDERVRGLQLFVNAVIKNLVDERSVREFFCLDEPPSIGDSEPEAQALFGALEDTVASLKAQLRQNEDSMKYMRQKIFYLEEKMRSCHSCNPGGHSNNASPHSASSSNCS